MQNIWLKTRGFPILTSLMRMIIFIGMSYGMLYFCGWSSNRMKLTREGISSHEEKVLSSNLIKIDEAIRMSALESLADLNSSVESKTKLALSKRIFQKSISLGRYETYGGIIPKETSISVQRKKASARELSRLSNQSNRPFWLKTTAAFWSALKLLFMSQICMLLYLGLLGVIRTKTTFPKKRLITHYVLLLLLTLPVLIIAISPEIFSKSDVPGSFLYESLWGKRASDIRWFSPFMYIWQIGFVVCFAGILSRSSIAVFEKHSPEENLNYYRGSADRLTAFRLAILRNSLLLKGYVPFFVIAVVFSRLRMEEQIERYRWRQYEGGPWESGSEGYFGLYSLLVDALKADTSVERLIGVFLGSMVILLVTLLGKAFFQQIHEALTPINDNSGVR